MAARILWALVVGLLFGVYLRSVADISWPVAGLFVLLGLIVLLAAYMDITKHRAALLIAVALVACAVGIVRMDTATLEVPHELVQVVGEEVVLIGRVAEEPDVRESNVRLTLQLEALVGGGATTSIQSRVLAIAPLHSDMAYGDTVRAHGQLSEPETFDTGSGHVFNYPMYLAKDGITLVLSFAEVERLASGGGTYAKRFALQIKHALLAGLHRALPEPQAGLASGIVLGEKRAAGESLSDAFIRSSLIHVVVLSGYNITLVLRSADWIAQSLPRIARAGAGGLVVTFFILMTGGAATAVRAGAMALIAVYARLTGRIFLALRALGAVSALMVLWNPYTLLFDPSFQLSALATLGLIVFTPHVAKVLGFIPARMHLREIAASTLATQLTVLPLLLYQSGTLSLVALPANLLALIAVPPAMALSAFASLAGIIAGTLAPFFAFPAYALLSYIISVAEFFASLPFASITLGAFSAWWLLFAYALIGVLAFMLQRKNGGFEPAVLGSEKK